MNSGQAKGETRALSQPTRRHGGLARPGAGTRRLLRLSDLVVTVGVTASCSRYFPGSGWAIPAMFVVLVSFWLEAMSLYRSRRITIRIDEWRRLFRAVGLAFATLVVFGFALAESPPRQWSFAATGSVFVALAISREMWRFRFSHLRGSGTIRRPTILVGANPEADMLADMLEDSALGYDIVCRVDPSVHHRSELLTTKVLASAARHNAVSALLVGSGLDVSSLNRLCRDLLEAGVHVELSMSLIDILHRRLTLRPLGRFPVAYIEPVHRDGWRPQMKRGFDIIASLVGLLLASPVLILIGVAIGISSRGSILFRQERVGRDGKNFDMLKFRTMVADAEDQLETLRGQGDTDGPLFKMRNDPRVTRVGRLLRRTSLDEVPQLFNVLSGDMSLVGPRPALRSEMTAWSPELYGRLRVRPGITGLWQVSGRSEASFGDYTRLDLYYVDNWSLTTDLRILARTVAAVGRSAGAY